MQGTLPDAPTRPVLRWHGGKWMLAPWIIAHFPPHHVYVEPFGGAANVLLRKPRSCIEVYNDLDDEVVTLFRVLQNAAQAARLRELLELTPFARREFLRAYEAADDPIECARRLIIRSFMGFGSNAHAQGTQGRRGRMTGFRCYARRSGTTPANVWRGYPDILPAIIERLRGVVIEHRDALQVMRQHDAPDALHYVDPPYLPETRSQSLGAYRHEMTIEDHAAMLAALKGLSGMVVLSGYPSRLYDEALSDWRRVETRAYADGARERTEVLWLNQRCADALEASTAPLLRLVPQCEEARS